MKCLKSIRNWAIALSATAPALLPTAFAASNPASAATQKTIVEAIIGIITDMAFFIGIILLVWSILQLVLAFKNEDADSKSRAIMLIVVSVALITLPALIGTILNTLGYTI